VLTLARAFRTGPAEEDDVVVRERRRRNRDVEGVVVGHWRYDSADSARYQAAR
jgi:hypothetical protein